MTKWDAGADGWSSLPDSAFSYTANITSASPGCSTSSASDLVRGSARPDFGAESKESELLSFTPAYWESVPTAAYERTSNGLGSAASGCQVSIHIAHQGQAISTVEAALDTLLKKKFGDLGGCSRTSSTTGSGKNKRTVSNEPSDVRYGAMHLVSLLTATLLLLLGSSLLLRM